MSAYVSLADFRWNRKFIACNLNIYALTSCHRHTTIFISWNNRYTIECKPEKKNKNKWEIKRFTEIYIKCTMACVCDLEHAQKMQIRVNNIPIISDPNINSYWPTWTGMVFTLWLLCGLHRIQDDAIQLLCQIGKMLCVHCTRYAFAVVQRTCIPCLLGCGLRSV